MIYVVGFDGIDLSLHLRPQLATYRQDAVMIGKQAVMKLVEQIEQHGKSMKSKYLSKALSSLEAL